MKERETPTALRGVSVHTLRQRYGARWPQPVQRWLKNASVAEVALWLEADSDEELTATGCEHRSHHDLG